MAIRFYGDESEDKEEKVHAVAGFIGWANQWERLQEEWINRVKPTGVSAYHMTDCDNGRGDFADDKGWKKEDRKQLTIDLIEIICRYRVFMIGIGVYLDDYKLLPPVTEDGELLGHDKWHSAFQAVLREAARRVEQSRGMPESETIAFCLDWKEKQGKADELFAACQNAPELPWRNRLGTLTFGHKEFNKAGSVPLLQVADIAALETRKSLAHELAHPELPERSSLARLKQAGRVALIAGMDKPYLEALYEMKRETLGLPNYAKEAQEHLDNLPRPRTPHH
jgi:hypothetical protein